MMTASDLFFPLDTALGEYGCDAQFPRLTIGVTVEPISWLAPISTGQRLTGLVKCFMRKITVQVQVQVISVFIFPH